MFGLAGVILDVAPQPDDKVVNGASVGVYVQSPNFLKNRLASNDATAIANQMPQQFRFHQSQLDHISIDSQFELAEVDGPPIKRERVVFVDLKRLLLAQLAFSSMLSGSPASNRDGAAAPAIWLAGWVTRTVSQGSRQRQRQIP